MDFFKRRDALVAAVVQAVQAEPRSLVASKTPGQEGLEVLAVLRGIYGQIVESY